MMRKLLGKDTTDPEVKPQPLKTGVEPGANAPHGNDAFGRSEPTLSERLKLQEGEGGGVSEPRVASSASAKTSAVPPPREDASQYSVVGQSMVIKGELEAAEDLEIAGRLEGSVKHKAKRLIVSKTGVVKASINAQNLIVEGRVEGDIECRESVVLKDTAEVTGDIQTVRLSIADGAQFSGKIEMVPASTESEASAG